MTILRVQNIGQYGVLKDASVHEAPINAWTDASNVRFLDGNAYQFYGHSEAYSSTFSVPYHVLPVVIAGVRHWLYASLTKIYGVYVDGAGSVIHTNLTRQTASVDVNYAATANSWTSTVLGGIPVLNPGNKVDPPQQWDLNLANNFAALSNWPANTYCKSMRSFRNFLVALNITKTTTDYPYMVKWSHPADPGSVPSSWDHTDPTKDAGEFDLSNGYDHITDGLALRDSLIIYKENSVWRMDYAGGTFIQRVQQVMGMSGAMNRNCIVEIDGAHLTLTTNDVVIHDGNQAYSVLDKLTRRWLFNNLDAAQAYQSFVFKNPFFNEVFICFCSVGSTIPDKAVVYNYKDKTVSMRSLPNIHHANVGQVDSSVTGASWTANPDPWNSSQSLWNSPGIVPNTARVIMAADNSKLYLLDAAGSYAGVAPTGHLERRGLSFGSAERVKLVRSIRPRISGAAGTTVSIKVGSQNDPYEEPTYTTKEHVIGSTVSNNFLVAGRYISIRFETADAYAWRLDSYDIDLADKGAY